MYYPETAAEADIRLFQRIKCNLMALNEGENENCLN
jgi:hypothetical protein